MSRSIVVGIVILCASCAVALRPASGPTTAPEWYAAGSSAMQAGDKATALRAFDRVIALDPDHADAWANRGTVLLNLGRFEEALASYDRALRIRPDPYCYCSRATVFNETGRYGEAVKSADDALAVDPRFAPAMANKARALEALGRHAEADRLFEEAFRLMPDLREHFPRR